MPIYEYECTECGHCEEVLQQFSDAPLTECPNCHGKMKKLMSMNSFHLKGSGWYVTDYASKKSSCSPPSSNSESTVKTKEASTPSKSDSSGGSGSAPTSKE